MKDQESKDPTDRSFLKSSSKNSSHMPFQNLPLTEKDSLLHNNDIKPPSKFSQFFAKIRLEIVIFVGVFSFVLTKISSTSMIMEKVCLAHYAYPQSICDNLQNYTNIKASIERTSTNYQIAHSLIQTIPAAIVACFIGPWSDNYGRKSPIIVAVTGISIDSIGSTVCAYFLNSRVEYYFIPAAFTGLSGGFVSLLAVVYSYASDTTPYSKRTLKYALIEVCYGIAQALGVFTGGWIYNFSGYPPVYFISTLGLLFSTAWIVLVLPETRGLENEDSCRTKLRNLFSCKTFSESFVATTKKRSNNGRLQIIFLISSMCFIVISTTSTTDINFLYVHHQFNWENTEYSTVTAIYMVFGLLLLFIVVPVLKYFKAGDPTLGIIGTTSLIIKFTGIGLAYKSSIFHIANLLGIFSPCASLAARSRISKVASKDDLGKVFSFVAIAESMLPVVTTVIIGQIFNAYLSTFPGMPYIILAVFLIFPFTVFIWLSCLPNYDYQEEIDQAIENRRESYERIGT